MHRPSVRTALTVWTVALIAMCVRVQVSARRGSVYPIFSTAGEHWLAGQDVYIEPTRELDQFRYTPAVAAFFAPWSYLPVKLAEVVWRCLNAVTFLGAL